MTGEAPRGGRWEQTEWGLPDWTDAETYGVNDYWDENRWRWEFLRRLPAYRAGFEAALATLGDDRLEVSEDAQDVADWLIRDGLRAWPFSHPSAEKYGLSELYDPVISDWMTLGPEWSTGLVYGGFDTSELKLTSAGVYEEVEAPHLTAFTFDLRRPLKAQLAEAHKELRQYQFEYFAYGEGLPDNMDIAEAEKWALGMPKTPRLHRKKWLTYLRVLDAKEDGASLSKIAEILPSWQARRDEKAADNVLKQAREQWFRF